MSGKCDKCNEHCVECKCKDPVKNITEMIEDAIDDLSKVPKDIREIIYWVATLENQQRVALVMACKILKQEE